MYLKIFASIACLMLAQTVLAVSSAEKFISFSDVHFDPYASCRLMAITPCAAVAKLRASPWQQWESIFDKYDSVAPTFGNDSGYTLLKSSLEELKTLNVQEKPRFGIFLGDFLAHNFHQQYILYSHDISKKGYEDFVEKTYEFLIHEYTQALPGLDIYPALGNNDVYEDYMVVVNGKLLHQQGEIWARLIHDKNNHEIFRSDFSTAGYYAVDLPGGKNQKMIVLNTVLFSRHLTGDSAAKAAHAELAWLHAQLLTATQAHQAVIMIFHIPMGVDVFATLKSFLNEVVGFWHADYSAAFENEMRQFASTVKIILPGHIHMDNFQIMSSTEKLAVPVSFTPSISPIYGNNPAFKIYSYNPQTLDILNYDTYDLPVSGSGAGNLIWMKEYNFNQIYQTTCTDCNLIKGMHSLTPRGESANFFKLYYGVSSESQQLMLDKQWLPYFWCDIPSVSAADYQDCIRQQ
jgi:sphingomyelin phosphodiesterase acid-like 3